MTDNQQNLEFENEAELPEAIGEIEAVIQATDWTTETIVQQMRRENILLNPNFQRRDAWDRTRKSEFIESLIVGLPVPQIVLAESASNKGKFIVLDGKQRLLSVLQFWGETQGNNNAFALSNLSLRPALSKKRFGDLSSESDLNDDYNALCNQSIRTMVIRNWKSEALLHTIFLRLNTGSVKLSPQELRQALHPGKYTSFVDEASADLNSLQKLMGLGGPDARMRDVEILARFLAFRFFVERYSGRMKGFLDESFKNFNAKWESMEQDVRQAVCDFDDGVTHLLAIFDQKPARKPGSSQFNRAIFDALIYFHSMPAVRTATKGKEAELRLAYTALFDVGSSFAAAVESDTAGTPNTFTRFSCWASSLSTVTGKEIRPPSPPKRT